MRKKLDTRFPAARIKKIMQTDEDVGKIAMAVPLLVSKALELFLQDLCDRTYEITLNRGAKTMNSLHLKQCVHSFNVFDFLKDTVSKVPDLGGGSDAAGEDRPVTKRRKTTDVEDNDSDEELKKSKVVRVQQTTHDPGQSTGIVIKRGRGRPRGRGRGGRTLERDIARNHDKYEDDPDMSKHDDHFDQTLENLHDTTEPERPKENISDDRNAEAPVRNFDLNVDLNDNGDSTTPTASVPVVSSAKSAIPELKHEEYPGWSLAEMEKMAIDPIQLANLNRRIDEEDEDYDEEG